jgi:hypothetical protein
MPGLGRRGRVRAHKEPMLLAPAKPVLVPKAAEKKAKKAKKRK